MSHLLKKVTDNEVKILGRVRFTKITEIDNMKCEKQYNLQKSKTSISKILMFKAAYQLQRTDENKKAKQVSFK